MNVQVTTVRPLLRRSPPGLPSLVPWVSVGLVIPRRGAPGQLLNHWGLGSPRGVRAWLGVALRVVSRVSERVPLGIYLEGVGSLDSSRFFLVQSDGSWRLDFKVLSRNNGPTRVNFGFNASPSSSWFFCCSTGAPASVERAASVRHPNGTLVRPEDSVPLLRVSTIFSKAIL